MTIPAHPDCHSLLHQLLATTPEIRGLVDSFPAAGDPAHVSNVLGLWHRIADCAPACSVLADCFITIDAGSMATGPAAIAISVDLPDRTQPVQLVRYVDTGHLTTDPDATGLPGVEASLDVLAAAIADLDRAVASLTNPDSVLHPQLAPAQPIPTGRPR